MANDGQDTTSNATAAASAATAATASSSTPSQTVVEALSSVTLPRIAIKFCTQCKWNLRAAYYAQEVLQTFSTSLGEVALIPATGGTFEIKIFYATDQDTSATENNGTVKVIEKVLWDRKVDGGFPETKELKGRVRDVVEPGRGLGHTDRALAKTRAKEEKREGSEREQENSEVKQGSAKERDAETGVEGRSGGGSGGGGGGDGPKACQDCS